jgi:hypothetical protein
MSLPPRPRPALTSLRDNRPSGSPLVDADAAGNVSFDDDTSQVAFPAVLLLGSTNNQLVPPRGVGVDCRFARRSSPWAEPVRLERKTKPAPSRGKSSSIPLFGFSISDRRPFQS